MKIYSQRLTGFRLLDEGGESGVSSARDEIGQREVVFKRCDTTSPKRQKEALTVIRLSRQLGDSGFLAVEDVLFEGDKISGYTFPLIELGNLRQVAADLDDPVLLGVLQTVCQSLAYLHSLDYLHCDIKPDNILIERIGEKVRPHVIDLGLTVRRGEQHVTKVFGALPFIAPELTAGKPLTETADIYSFGKMLGTLVPGLRDDRLRSAIEAFGGKCTRDDPAERPPTFWDVHDALRRLHDRIFGPAERDILPPPLRDTGVRLRVSSLGQHIEISEGQWRGVCLVAGATGVGKSKIVREFALERQLAGEETIRVTGVSSSGDLIDVVNSRIPRPRRRSAGIRKLWITAETLPECTFSANDLLRLHSAVCNSQAVLLLEHRGPVTRLPSDDIRTVGIKPFGLRECVVASSHLQNDPSVSPINGQALLIASAGNPWLLRQCLKIRMTGPRSDRNQEPADFDRLNAPIADFWSHQFELLEPSLRALVEDASVFHSEFDLAWLTDPATPATEVDRMLTDLVKAGWLRRTGMPDRPTCGQIVSRTARNYVRKRVGTGYLKSVAERLVAGPPMGCAGNGALTPASLWELHRIAGRRNGAPSVESLWESRQGLDDVKLAALSLLAEYRHSRASGGGDSLSMSARISEAFDLLGSSRRRKHWATVAIGQLPAPAESDSLSIDDARFLCHLYELAGEAERKEQALAAILDHGSATDPHVRGFLLSEMGTQRILANAWNEASDLFFQAHHLLESAAPTSSEYVRNLNRVGLTLMRQGRWLAARKRLVLCRKLAQDLGYNHITRLSLGNLSILERELGNPQEAMRYSRRAMQSYRRARDATGYMRALPDRVMCLVHLGEGYRATRTAQLAVWLANLHSSQIELRFAHNNLGWILMMQGEAGKAREQLDAAIRLHERVGDAVWVVRSRLNLAWTFLLAGDLERAEEFCQSGLNQLTEHDDLHGHCEAMHILAKTAIMRENWHAAREYLARIPEDNPKLSPLYKTETELAWLNLSLWQGELAESERRADDLANNPIVQNVHPMRCDFGRMRGMLYTLQGDYDRALDILGDTASECRRGGRVDKLIDTMIAQVFLAQRMHNWPVGRGYLKTIDKLTNIMRQQLQS